MAGNLIKKDGILEKGNLRIPFQIIRSSRKTLAVQVKADGQVVIRVPLRTQGCQQSETREHRNV